MTLFGRVVTLEVGTAGGEGLALAGLRTSFRVSQSRSRTPNEATVRVWGLSASTAKDIAGRLKASDGVIKLFAGYRTAKQIFIGEPVRHGVRVDPSGAERVLRVQAQDGGRRYRDSYVDVSFASSTTARQVLNEVLAQMQLPAGTIQLDESARWPYGFHASGPARDVLDRIADQAGAEWFIRNGVVHVLQPGSRVEQGPVISAANGNLIGSPQQTDEGIQVTALLLPSVRPGTSFEVRSEQHSGEYVARDVVHEGDTGFDRPFYTTVTGRPRG